MKVSFKQFSKFVDLPQEEVSDEQLTEIFGLFQNNKKVDDLKAKRTGLKQAEIDKRKQIDKKKDELFAKRAAELRHNGGFNPLEKGTGTMRSAAATGRAAERDWVAGLTSEGVDANLTAQLEKVVRDIEEGKYDLNDVLNNRSAARSVSATVGNYLQHEYDSIASDHRLHPDDDFEKIEEILWDHLEKDYS
jgi:hypothetical protein